jgi:hypothetical protein
MYELAKQKVIRRSWIQTANIPKARVGWTLQDCNLGDKKILEGFTRWLTGAKEGKIILASGKKDCGRGILLYGDPGRGKTTMALAALQDIMLTFPLEALVPSPGKVLIRPCYFSTFNEVLSLKGRTIGGADDEENMLYEGMLGEAPDDAYNIRVLIIDDVGKEHASLSGWQSNVLHDVLRTRFNNGLPTIVTTNIAREDWEISYGPATASFAKEAFVYFPISAQNNDLRK